MSVDARGVCARSWGEAWVLGDMNGRKWAVDNVELVAHWDWVIDEVVLAIVTNVYASAKNVGLDVLPQDTKGRTLPCDLKPAWAPVAHKKS